MASEIADAFGRVAADRPDRIAVFGLGDVPTRTFGELAAGARALRPALAAAGLPDSPCVISAVGNDPAFFAVLLAVLEMNGALVLFDAADRLDGVRGLGPQLGADALIVSAEAAAGARLDGAALPDRLRLLPIPPAVDARWRHDGRRPAILKMTSGSSGEPRAVVAAERHVINDARHVTAGMGIGPADVSLGVIPLAHSYGLGNLVLPLLLQGSPVALRRAFAPRHLAEDVAGAGVAVLPGVPFMYEHLRRHDLAGSLAAVRLLITAGAPMAHETVAFFKRSVGLTVHSFYGSSETGGITYDDGDEVGDEARVGRPLPGVQVEIRADAPREAGRVFVRSDAVAAGYAWPDPGDTGVFVDGGFLTGDLGRVEDGALALTGRVTRFINVAGRKVDPREVERVLRESSSVLEVHVFGMPCDRRGEQVVACVRRAEPGPASDLRAFCAARLPAWKVPRQIVDVEAMPRDARGKVSRGALEQLIAHTRTRAE
jgi:long-chain acyl-CoA synthetase